MGSFSFTLLVWFNIYKVKVLSFVSEGGKNLKWIVKDVEQFEQAREYVDTGVIPLLSISAAKMKMVVEQGEFIELLSTELERV